MVYKHRPNNFQTRAHRAYILLDYMFRTEILSYLCHIQYVTFNWDMLTKRIAKRVDAKDAVEHPTGHRMVPTTKNCLAPMSMIPRWETLLSMELVTQRGPKDTCSGEHAELGTCHAWKTTLPCGEPCGAISPKLLWPWESLRHLRIESCRFSILLSWRFWLSFFFFFKILLKNLQFG